MNRSLQRLLTLVEVVALVMFGGVADAKSKKKRGKHHDAHSMTKEKLKTDGTHEIHKKGKHTAHAEVKGGKIKAFKVKHAKKGHVAVRKVKSKKKKMSTLDVEEPIALDTTYVSYGYCYDDDDDDVEDCYWYPVEAISDDFSGADDDDD